MAGTQCERRLGYLAFRILNVLSFINDDRAEFPGLVEIEVAAKQRVARDHEA